MDAEHQKNVIFEKVLPISKSNSPTEDDVTEKSKVEAVGLVFHVASKNVVVFDAAPWKSVALTSLFSRNQNDFFENRSICFLCPLAPEKRICSSDCNGIRTHNHLVRKRTLNHLAKL